MVNVEVKNRILNKLEKSNVIIIAHDRGKERDELVEEIISDVIGKAKQNGKPNANFYEINARKIAVPLSSILENEDIVAYYISDLDYRILNQDVYIINAIYEKTRNKKLIITYNNMYLSGLIEMFTLFNVFNKKFFALTRTANKVVEIFSASDRELIANKNYKILECANKGIIDFSSYKNIDINNLPEEEFHIYKDIYTIVDRVKEKIISNSNKDEGIVKHDIDWSVSFNNREVKYPITQLKNTYNVEISKNNYFSLDEADHKYLYCISLNYPKLENYIEHFNEKYDKIYYYMLTNDSIPKGVKDKLTVSYDERNYDSILSFIDIYEEKDLSTIKFLMNKYIDNYKKLN